MSILDAPGISPAAYKKRLILEKLNRAFSAAGASNPETSDLMTSPPIITQFAGAPVSPVNVALTIRDTPSAVRMLGGKFVDYNGLALRPVTTTLSDGSTLAYSGAYEFITDAPVLIFEFAGPVVTARFCIDGKYVSKTPTNYASGSNVPRVKMDFSAARKSRRIAIYSATALAKIYTDSPSRVTAPASEDVVRAIYTGDSYTAAVGAQFFCADSGWSQVASKLLGFKDARSCGIGGTGYLNPGTAPGAWKCRDHIADITDPSVSPDIVIFAHGANDLALSPPAIGSEVTACLGLVRAALPSIPIVVLGAWPLGTGPSAQAVLVETAIATAVANFKDTFCKFSPVINEPSGSWIFGQGKTGAVTGFGNADFYLGGVDGMDGTHANDAGHSYLGFRAAQAIKKAVSQMIV